MRISVIQMNSGSDKVANLEQARTLIDEAVREDRPHLVALPETFTILGGGDEVRRAAAEWPAEGEAWRMLSNTARDHAIHLHGGSLFERDRECERLANTSLVFDPQGREIARYRKLHLFDVTTPDGAVYRESDYTVPGGELVTVAIGDFVIGLSICYDLRFPGLYGCLRGAGADVLMVPSAFTLMTGKDHWEPLLRARAIENQCYVVAPAQCGAFESGKGVRYTYGHSMIVDPWGHVMARVGDGPGFATARLERQRLDEVRTRLPVHDHRRPLPEP